MCDFVSGARYFDYADNESGNWGATSVLSSTPTLIKLLRNSSDGIWTLTQTISKVAASGSAPGAAKVVMALKNNTAVARGVYLLRHADVDANATSGDDNSTTHWTRRLVATWVWRRTFLIEWYVHIPVRGPCSEHFRGSSALQPNRRTCKSGSISRGRLDRSTVL